MRPLKVGLVVPTWCSPPDRLRWADILDLAREAENAGFDSLWASDHLLLESTNAELRRRAGGEVPPGAEELPEGYFEAFSALAALAAAVPGMELGTLVACTAYRNPGLLAKIADAIDDISGGRFILGVGASSASTTSSRSAVSRRRSRSSAAFSTRVGSTSSGASTASASSSSSHVDRARPGRRSSSAR